MNGQSTMSRTERARLRRKQREQQWKWAAIGILFVIMIVSALMIAWGWMEKSGGNGKATAPDPAEPADLPPVEKSSETGGSETEDTEDKSDMPQEDPSQQDSRLDESEAAAGKADEKVDDPSQRVHLAFVGDVLLGSTVETNLLQKHGYDYPYWHVRDLLRAADFLAANLETPITERGEPEDKQYVYRSRPKALPAFRDAGFDLVGLANNHILDYGLVGLEDTLHHLKQNSILYVGAGMDIDEAFRPQIIEMKGMRIAYLAFSQVVPHNDWKATRYQGGVADTYALERPIAEIEKAKEDADLVVVLVHWGQERVHEPNERQMETAKAYIDAGADLVIGSHPHVLQSLQSYKGKWIAYSLGNFIFTTNDHPPTWESVILNAYCDKNGNCELELVPVSVKWAQPVQMEKEEGRRSLKKLEELSPGVIIDDTGKVSRKEHGGTGKT